MDFVFLQNIWWWVYLIFVILFATNLIVVYGLTPDKKITGKLSPAEKLWGYGWFILMGFSIFLFNWTSLIVLLITSIVLGNIFAIPISKRMKDKINAT